MEKSFFVGLAGLAGFFASVYFASRGASGAVKDLEGQTDQLEASARQSRQDIASIVWVLSLTNALLAGILGALVHQLL
ncbi:hypothetical protein [Sinorhizobium meliloti]|uniref:hypothetical protein n=1 Tax=Rhizobium meliloti TaxID=382 RepID=UPI00299D78AA|nr:hypothetical protein [Sinorhizobium meliloti]MDW9692127.1 hypothetical protein [Sinorhizobium meliloti]MDW9715825.1 hypothetical protein [Sinorhizobium meliloti]MDW9752691.1 hypothetical protein [Sinorhizobium meliloti]